jgi:Ca-activated chloride channel homolog
VNLLRTLRSGSSLLSLLLAVGCGAAYSGAPMSEAYAPPPSPLALADAPSPGEAYADYGVNPFVDASQDKLSTFAIDVDTASFSISRRKLTEGTLPPKDAVRVEEFVNSFDYAYPAPTEGPFAVHLDAAPSPYRQGSHLLRVGLQTKRPAARDRKPVHLVYLVDTSGSMQSADKIGLIKESLRMLTAQLQQGDTVALCTYAGSTREVLAPTGVSERVKILAAIDELSAGGGTAMASGMESAYGLASRTKKPGEISRVVVLSDGDANIGASSHDEILRGIERYKEQGITLSTVGFGNGNYKDTMMEQLADKGDGNYTYIDSREAAHKAFVENLGALLEVVAKDVKVQVEFDPAVVKRYRLVGYENRDVADKDFRNDKVDGGEVGAGHSVTAVYEVELTDAAKGRSLASVSLRWKSPEGGQAEEKRFEMAASSVVSDFADAPRSLRLATAIVGFAETLRESPHAGGLDQALSIAERAMAQESRDETELVSLMKRAIELGASRKAVVAKN